VPSISSVLFSIAKPRRRNSKMRAFYCAALAMISGRGTQAPGASISRLRMLRDVAFRCLKQDKLCG
jgi:hypothetical protein